MLDKKFKFFTPLNNMLRKLRFKKSYFRGVKLILILNLFLLLIIGAVTAHYLFFTRIDIKIAEIEWIDEFKITVIEIELRDEPCFLVIESENSEIVSEREFQIQKQNIRIGECTNSRILIPLRIEGKIENNENLFFVPQFRARIKGGEKTEEKDLRLKAGFSLYLLTNHCPEGKERINLKGDSVLCSLHISSFGVRSFSITERRKNILADEIKNIAAQHNYVLVLKVSPDLETVKTLSYFSIAIENITPELIIPL